MIIAPEVYVSVSKVKSAGVVSLAVGMGVSVSSAAGAVTDTVAVAVSAKLSLFGLQPVRNDDKDKIKQRIRSEPDFFILNSSRYDLFEEADKCAATFCCPIPIVQVCPDIRSVINDLNKCCLAVFVIFQRNDNRPVPGVEFFFCPLSKLRKAAGASQNRELRTKAITSLNCGRISPNSGTSIISKLISNPLLRDNFLLSGRKLRQKGCPYMLALHTSKLLPWYPAACFSSKDLLLACLAGLYRW